METKKVGDMAEGYGVQMNIHMAESPVACLRRCTRQSYCSPSTVPGMLSAQRMGQARVSPSRGGPVHCHP